MTHVDQAAQKPAPKEKKSLFTLNDVLKCAAILMCLSVAYKSLYKPDVAAPAASPAVLSQAAGLPEAKVSAKADDLKIDTDKIAELLKKKSDSILAAGPVRMSLGQTSQPQPQVSAPAVAAPAPVANQPTQAQQPAVAIAHPGSADANRVPKIGFRADGSQMTPSEKTEQIKGIIAKIPDRWTVNWKAENEKASIYVFTDPTCPYCQKLHHSIAELNAAGVTVHYFLYPRDMGHNTGYVSKTQENLNNVWCSVNQQAAMDDAYAGYKIPATDCSQLPADLNRMRSPVADHYFLGELFDVKGTPTIITADGQVIVGFSNTASLIKAVLN